MTEHGRLDDRLDDRAGAADDRPRDRESGERAVTPPRHQEHDPFRRADYVRRQDDLAEVLPRDNGRMAKG